MHVIFFCYAETKAWFIDSFEAWRKAINLDSFILLRHSFGGCVAAKFALKVAFFTVGTWSLQSKFFRNKFSDTMYTNLCSCSFLSMFSTWFWLDQLSELQVNASLAKIVEGLLMSYHFVFPYFFYQFLQWNVIYGSHICLVSHMGLIWLML